MPTRTIWFTLSQNLAARETFLTLIENISELNIGPPDDSFLSKIRQTKRNLTYLRTLLNFFDYNEFITKSSCVMTNYGDYALFNTPPPPKKQNN